MLEASTLYIFLYISHLCVFILIRQQEDEVAGAITVYVSAEWICLCCVSHVYGYTDVDVHMDVTLCVCARVQTECMLG